MQNHMFNFPETNNGGLNSVFLTAAPERKRIVNDQLTMAGAAGAGSFFI